MTIKKQLPVDSFDDNPRPINGGVNLMPMILIGLDVFCAFSDYLITLFEDW